MFLNMSGFQDEDDQQFLMDELGNIELSPRCVPAHALDGGEEDVQERWDDDASCLEALDEVERTMQGKEEIPDDLMIQALAECEANTV